MLRTILLITSDLELLKQITAHIETRGDFRIYAASTDEDALSTAAGRKVDAVILDEDSLGAHLPSFMDDLTDILPDTRILRFQNQNDREINDSTYHLVLHKPFSQSELDTALEEIPVVNTVPAEDEGSPFDEDFLTEDVELGELSDYLGEAELNNLNNLLENMPPPDPEAEIESEIKTETGAETLPPPIPSTTEDWIPMDLIENESAANSISSGIEPSLEPFESNIERIPPTLPPLPVSDEVTEGPAETSILESPIVEESSAELVESLPGTAPLGVMSARFNYYCVLIPNKPDQFLARDISDRLGFILPQLHIANGWRVTSLSIRPLFMMWQVSLPADTSPADAVLEIRHRTSSHLYTNFKELLTKNDQNDFWAPGYLILSGTQAPSNSLINDYIKRTRSAQQDQSK